MDFKLRPQLPLLALRYVTFVRFKPRIKRLPQSAVSVAQVAHLYVLSLCHHDCVESEPVAPGDPSVDEFWESW